MTDYVFTVCSTKKNLMVQVMLEITSTRANQYSNRDSVQKSNTFLPTAY